MVSLRDLELLKLCISLAREALKAGDAPFGSVLTSANGTILRTERNRTVTGEKGDFKADATLHPEFVLARWAQLNLSPQDRAAATVYTSGEHCAMCAAAHAYVGLGRIVYASSTSQFISWTRELGVKKGGSGVKPLAIGEVAPGIEIEGPVEGLDEEVKDLHRQRLANAKDT